MNENDSTPKKSYQRAGPTSRGGVWPFHPGGRKALEKIASVFEMYKHFVDFTPQHTEEGARPPLSQDKPAGVNFAQVNLTLTFSYTNKGSLDTGEIVKGILEKLNATPEYAKVEATHVVGEWLGWPHFLDAPFDTEGPEYEKAVAIYNKVEYWLTLDRKQLINALVKLQGDFDHLTTVIAESASRE